MRMWFLIQLSRFFFVNAFEPLKKVLCVASSRVFLVRCGACWKVESQGYVWVMSSSFCDWLVDSQKHVDQKKRHFLSYYSILLFLFFNRIILNSITKKWVCFYGPAFPFSSDQNNFFLLRFGFNEIFHKKCVQRNRNLIEIDWRFDRPNRRDVFSRCLTAPFHYCPG